MTDLDRDQFVTRWHEAVALKSGVEADPDKLRATGVSLLSGDMRKWTGSDRRNWTL